MKLTKIDKAFEVWRENGQLNEAQIEALRRTLAESQGRQRSARAVVLFSTLGAVLLGLGVVLFVSSHWDNMGPATRSFVLIATYVATLVAAHITQRKEFPLLSESLWFLATLVLGANIFLIGQLFNFTLTFWQGPFLWCIAAVAMGLARGKAAYAWLGVPLGLLALGWLDGGSGWFADDQFEFLVSERGLLPLLPLIGIALFCFAALTDRSEHWAFLRPACAAWGLGLIAIPLVVGTSDRVALLEMFRMDFTSKQVGMVLASALAVLLFALRGRASKQSLAAVVLLWLMSAVLLVPYGGESAIGALVQEHSPVFVLYILLVFAIALGAIWVGLTERSTALIHVGLASASIIIFIQYFSWSFALLDRSLAFIMGGVVLLGVGYALERTRRHLLARMEGL